MVIFTRPEEVRESWALGRPNRPSNLTREFVTAAHELTRSKRPPYWVSVDQVVKKLGGGVSEKIDEAIHLAALQNLLRTDGGHAPFPVCVTASGMILAEKS
jgi:hypothetical protein